MAPLVKVPLKYGLIAGVLGAVLVIGLYLIGKQHPFLIPIYLDFRIFLFGVFVFFSLKEFRDYYQQGELYFSQAILSSFVFIVVYAVISSLIIWIFGTVNPSFITSFVTELKQQLSTWSAEDIARIGKETFERNIAGLSTTNAFDLAFNYFTQCFLLGAIVSIILSVTLRRQPKT